MSAPKREKGDKIEIHGDAEDKKVLVSYILCVFDEKGRKNLKIVIKDLSERLMKEDAHHPGNKYRKMYGNIRQCFFLEDFKHTFRVEGDVLVLLPMEKLEDSYKAGHLQDADIKLCQDIHKAKVEHDIKTLKIVHSNECARCGAHYKEAVGHMELCHVHTQEADDNGHYKCCKKAEGCKKAPHIPYYDFKSGPPAVIKYDNDTHVQ